MRNYDFCGLKDLWNDFNSAIKEREVNLSDAKIYQVEDYDELEDNKARLYLLKTDVRDLKQCKKTMKVSKKTAAKLCHIGCFYEIDGLRYVPTDEVKNRSLRDYFGIKKGMTVNSLSEKEFSLLLASKFRGFGKIIFIAETPANGTFYKLIGIKSTNGNNNVRIIDIAEELHNVYGEDISFYTNYAEQGHVSVDFMISCVIRGLHTKEGFPLSIEMSDSASMRKSMRFNIAVEISNRKYILDSIEVNHRCVELKSSIANNIKEMAEKYVGVQLNMMPSVIDICLPYVPKKAHQKFKTYVESSKLTPLEAAYDVMFTDIFNLRLKQHKTSTYDGGKYKYERALGSSLLS